MPGQAGWYSPNDPPEKRRADAEHRLEQLGEVPLPDDDNFQINAWRASARNSTRRAAAMKVQTEAIREIIAEQKQEAGLRALADTMKSLGMNPKHAELFALSGEYAPDYAGLRAWAIENDMPPPTPPEGDA